MAMAARSEFFKRALNTMTSQATHLSVCATQPTNGDNAWAKKGSSGYALARSSSAGSAIFGTPGSTTDGWTVASSSFNSMTVDAASSGTAGHIAVLSGTASTDLLFITTCTARGLTTADTVSVPSFNIRIGDPTSS